MPNLSNSPPYELILATYLTADDTIILVYCPDQTMPGTPNPNFAVKLFKQCSAQRETEREREKKKNREEEEEEEKETTLECITQTACI